MLPKPRRDYLHISQDPDMEEGCQPFQQTMVRGVSGVMA
jgi:hypothetical protein